MNVEKVCLFVAILCLHKHFSTSQVYLPSIITAIDSTLQYYGNNYVRMNLDGIFGLRVLEGLYDGFARETCLGLITSYTVSYWKRSTFKALL